MDFWMEITGRVIDGDKAVWTENNYDSREVFREAWAFVESEWAAKPRPLTLEITIGTDARPGTTLTVNTQVRPAGKRIRCTCTICGWDEARLSTRELRLRDEFGLTFESPLEALVADGPRTLSAVWTEIQCPMCTELDAAGLDRVTKRPVEAK